MSYFDPRKDIKEELYKKNTIFGLSKPTWWFLAVGAAFVAGMAVFFNVIG